MTNNRVPIPSVAHFTMGANDQTAHSCRVNLLTGTTIILHERWTETLPDRRRSSLPPAADRRRRLHYRAASPRHTHGAGISHRAESAGTTMSAHQGDGDGGQPDDAGPRGALARGPAASSP